MNGLQVIVMRVEMETAHWRTIFQDEGVFLAATHRCAWSTQTFNVFLCENLLVIFENVGNIFENFGARNV